jgi:hypothetical protein
MSCWPPPSWRSCWAPSAARGQTPGSVGPS